MMSTATDLAEIAREIAEQAEKLDRARDVLREHPEQVADVIDHLSAMLSSLDRVLDTARAAFQEQSATAVTTFGDQTLGSERAMFTGGLLAAASAQVQGLQNTLMGVGAETSALVWPEHDPLAAEELHNYQRFLQQREHHLTPDAESLPTASESLKRDSMGPS